MYPQIVRMMLRKKSRPTPNLIKTARGGSSQPLRIDKDRRGRGKEKERWRRLRPG